MDYITLTIACDYVLHLRRILITLETQTRELYEYPFHNFQKLRIL